MLYKPTDSQPATALMLRLVFHLLPSIISYCRRQICFARSLRPGELQQQAPAWIFTLPLSQHCSNTPGCLRELAAVAFGPLSQSCSLRQSSTRQAHQSWAGRLGPSIKPCWLALPQPITARMLTTNTPITITAGTIISMHSY